jgi:hypothetical protein
VTISLNSTKIKNLSINMPSNRGGLILFVDELGAGFDKLSLFIETKGRFEHTSLSLPC